MHDALNEGDLDRVRELRQTKTFATIVSQHGVDLISSISKFMDDERIYKCPHLVECYEEILESIVDEIDPDDLFVTLLEQVDEESCCIEKFLMLLDPLKFTLVKLGSSREYWLEWTLSTIKFYLESVHFPEDHDIEFDEKIMTVNDPHVDKLLHLSEKLVVFYETFLNDTISAREIDALIAFGFHILAEPVMYLYLEKFEKLQEICDQVLRSIGKLYGKSYCLFEFIDETKALDVEELEPDKDTYLDEDSSDFVVRNPLWAKIKILPLAVYYSVRITETPLTNYFPLVFSPVYLFHKLLYLSVLLMKNFHNAVVRKGLLLCDKIFQSTPNGSIPYGYLEYKVHKKFVAAVSRICIYSYIFENRKLAIELLQSYVLKFDPKGTYLLLMNITSETGSEDIDSEIITIFRKMMHTSFVENNFQYYQKGKYLIDLLKIFAKLGEGSDTDLIASKNKIVSLLYLFALMLRRDAQNQTGIHDYYDHFDRNYFTVIEEAIEKSREKYKRDAVTFINNDDPLPFEDNVSIVVEGKSLPRLQREDKINATKNALCALDMIEHAMQLVYEYNACK